MFAHRLSEALRKAGLTQSDLARKLSYSKQAVSTWVSDKRQPKKPVIDAIALLLNVSSSWLCSAESGQQQQAAGCLGRYGEERGCSLELDSPYQSGDCCECMAFGCVRPEDMDCRLCSQRECVYWMDNA